MPLFRERGTRGAGVTCQMRRCIPQSYQSAHSHLHCPSLAQPHHDFLVELGICPSEILWIHCQTDLKLLPRPSLSRRHESHISTSSAPLVSCRNHPRRPSPPPREPPSSVATPSTIPDREQPDTTICPPASYRRRTSRDPCQRDTRTITHWGHTRETTLTPKKKRDKWPTTTNPQSTTRSKSKT